MNGTDNRNLHVDRGYQINCRKTGFIKNSYTLDVSAPSMIEGHEYRKIDAMVDLLFEFLTIEERILINTVKIYDNKKELRQNLSFDFKDQYSNDFEGVVQFDNDLFEVA